MRYEILSKIVFCFLNCICVCVLVSVFVCMGVGNDNAFKMPHGISHIINCT